MYTFALENDELAWLATNSSTVDQRFHKPLFTSIIVGSNTSCLTSTVPKGRGAKTKPVHLCSRALLLCDSLSLYMDVVIQGNTFQPDSDLADTAGQA